MQGRSVLIVEDEQIVATELREILTSLGYRIVAVTSTGPEALAKTEETQPDLILMDIRIKGTMDGIETASKITNRWDIPIIYLTAHADQETLRRAKVTGPMGYVLKPFSERELLIAIEIAIYKHGMERQLREQKQRLAAMLDSIGDAVIATDAEGLVTLVNPAASALTGFAEAEALGRDITTVLNIVDEATRTNMGSGVTKLAAGRSPVTSRELRLHDNHQKWQGRSDRRDYKPHSGRKWGQTGDDNRLSRRHRPEQTDRNGPPHAFLHQSGARPCTADCVRWPYSGC